MSKLCRLLMVAVAAVFGLIGLADGADAKTKLRMNHQMTANTVGGIVDQWFADEVKKRTNGEVEIKIFFSDGLGSAKETLGLLESGAIDMAGLSPGYFPDQLPFFTAPNSIPMTMETLDQATHIMPTFMAEVPSFWEEAKAHGIRPIWFHHLNPYLLVGKEPILSAAAMKGKKMRTWGSDMPRMVEAQGGVPVTLQMGELYESLLRGVVDAIPFSVDLMQTYKMYEVAKHIMWLTVWEGPTWGVWITDKAWEKLTPGQQKIFEEVAVEAKARDFAANKKAAKEAVGFLKSKGVTFHDFPEAEKAKWRANMPDFFSEWIAKMEKKGKGNDARKTVELWKEIVAKYK